MACLRWLPTRKINFAQKIHLFAKYLRNFMSRTKAALNGHREKNSSFRNKKWVLQSLGIRPRLCVSPAWMFVARDIYLGITKVQAALIYTRATFIVRGDWSEWPLDICFTVVIYWDNSRLEICDGEQMRLRSWEDVSDNRAHNTQAQDYSFALYCLLRVMLHPDSLL